MAKNVGRSTCSGVVIGAVAAPSGTWITAGRSAGVFRNAKQSGGDFDAPKFGPRR